jgi:hypothetical protein
MIAARRFAIIAALMLAVGGVAAAQDAPATRKPAKTRGKGSANGARVKPDKKSKNLIFEEGSDVTGTLQAPDGETTVVHRGARHTSLIKVRENFIPEILKSAEDL